MVVVVVMLRFVYYYILYYYYMYYYSKYYLYYYNNNWTPTRHHQATHIIIHTRTQFNHIIKKILYPTTRFEHKPGHWLIRLRHSLVTIVFVWNFYFCLRVLYFPKVGDVLCRPCCSWREVELSTTYSRSLRGVKG